MKTAAVWKWELPLQDVATIQVPKGTEFLHVHDQHQSLCIWGLCDPAEDQQEERTFRVAGTGHPLANGKFKYIGSAHSRGGHLVFHVFECL